MNILITSAGQRVSLIKAFKKELADVSMSAKVYTTDANPILAPACHISDKFFKVPSISDANFLKIVLSICKENNISILIPTIDTELLIFSNAKEEFLQSGIKIVISNRGFIEKCRDKRKTNYLFTQYGIDIPEQYPEKNYKFPLFAKPFNGSLSKDLHVIKSIQDLDNFDNSDNNFMLMEYIDSADYDEYTVDAYYDKKSSLICAVPRRRMVVRAGEINKGVTKKNILGKIFLEKLSFLTGAIGCVTIQLFLHKNLDTVKGIEINPRFGGGYPLSYCAGANYPKFILKEYIFNEKLSYYDEWIENLLMLRYDDEVIIRNYND